MTYSSSAAALGAAADTQIAALTATNSSQTVTITNLSGSVNTLTASVAYLQGLLNSASPTPPPPAPPAASGAMVFSHYFTPYWISYENAQPFALSGAGDYYDKHYLYPATGGYDPAAAVAYAGLLRDRPKARMPLAAGVDFRTADMATEIANAKSAGIDGFTVDLLASYSTTDNNSVQVQKLLAAADADGTFKIVLMPDMNGGMGSLSASSFASSIASYAAHKSAYRLTDGRLVISPFLAEKFTVAQWQSVFAELAKLTDPITKAPFTVAFVPCFLNVTVYPTYASICYGYSYWGDRSPSASGYGVTALKAAHTAGKIFMQPVSVQDSRPNQSIYWESQNTENLRCTWKVAIDNRAEWIQIPTWNDFSENAHIAPTEGNKGNWLKLNKYYINWFKTGVQPAITSDALFITHRQHPAAATPTFAETSKMSISPYSVPARDTVEALVFLTASATVTLNVGTASATFNGLPGINVFTTPLTSGSVSGTIVRNGVQVVKVSSPVVVTTTPIIQNLLYYPSTNL